MNWVSRKIHLYNVTMGLYLLNWWERYLFNIMLGVLLWFTLCSGTDLCNSHLKSKVGDIIVGRNIPS